MDIWNWLQDQYNEGLISLQDLEEAMTDDKTAQLIWNEYAFDSGDFVSVIRDEIWPFIDYVKRKKMREEYAAIVFGEK